MLKTLLMVLAFGFTVGIAHAEDAADKGQGACKADAEKLCPAVQPGDGRIVKCLHENKDKLSSECSAHMSEKKEAMKGKMQDMREGCRADKEKFCKDAKMGHGRILKCLEDHQAELSDDCKKMIEEMPRHANKSKREKK